MSLGGIHQYQANTASNTQTMGSVKETIGARPTAQVQELAPGKVFEGMVTEVKNGQVTLGLSDGRTISARMEAGVTLEQGQPMLFEVKANTGDQISIRPVTLESAQNPTLLKALEAAGLKVNPRNLSMVNQMMMEQMPIDKSSLMQMARAVANFPQADMQVLVQMQKLGFVINENSLNQFQNYQNGQQAILPQMQELMEGIANLPEQIFGKEGIGQNDIFLENFVLDGSQDFGTAGIGQNTEAGQLLGLQKQILGILLGDNGNATPLGGENGSQSVPNGEQAGQPAINGEAVSQTVQSSDGMNQMLQNGEAVSKPAQGSDGMNQMLQNGEAVNEILQNKDGISSPLQNGDAANQNVTGELARASQMGGAEEAAGKGLQNPIDAILTKEQQGNLTAMLQEFPGAQENETLLPQGRLNTSLSAGEMLQQMMGILEKDGKADGSSLKKLFSSEEFKGLMKQAMAEQWTLTPEKLKEEGAVRELYQRLARQMTELQQTLAQTGKEGTALAKTAQSVQSNLEFMNQLNQIYTYVQLPLKLQQQNAHSDLYVYTNKKNLREKEGDLSALLHLDLEHLGSTDIFVKLHGQAVQTDFYLADELSFQLILNFTGQLVERLEQKGYSCEVKVENRKEQKNSVQEFLEQEKPAGKLHRYSFDVKA